MTVVQIDDASRRSCVESNDRDAALAIESAKQRRQLELIAQIERRRGLVHEQDRPGLAVGRESGVNALVELCERRRDDHALSFAAAERR